MTTRIATLNDCQYFSMYYQRNTKRKKHYDNAELEADKKRASQWRAIGQQVVLTMKVENIIV